MSDLSFARPEALLLFILVPLALVAWWFAVRRSRRHARAMSRSSRPRSGLLSMAFALSGLALAIVAFAQPRWDTETVPVIRTGADVMFVLDVSRSMNATDVQPSRLQAARSAIAGALERSGGDRAGLVVFAGDARLGFPLTTDLAAAATIIERLEPGVALVGAGSAIGPAIDLASNSFDEESEAGRLIVLITDGENLGESPANAASRLRFTGTSLLVAGIGTAEGGEIPVLDADGNLVTLVDEAGMPVISRLDEATLVDIAARGGGRYLGNSIQSLPGAVASRIDALETARLAETPAEVPVERFGLFSAIGAGILALTLTGGAVAALGGRMRRRRVVPVIAALLAIPLFAACAERSYELNEDGLTAYELGDFEVAIEHFTEASSESPADGSISLNLALAYHAAGRFDEAERASERASASTDREVQLAALKALGHHRFEQQDLVGALEAFHDALILAPGDATARHDYEVVYALLNPPPPPDDQDPGDSGQPGEPGEGTPTPGTGPGQPGSPTPGGTPQPGGTPSPVPGEPTQPGEPGPATPSDIESRIQEIDDEVRSLLENDDGEQTLEEALRLLELVEERNRLAALLQSGPDNQDPSDR